MCALSEDFRYMHPNCEQSAECSETMQTAVKYAGAHTSQHISHLETFKKV